MPNTNRPTISTHVLDLTRGEPAAGVVVTLSRAGQEIVRETDADGRIADLGEAVPGSYQLSFDVAGYYKKKGGAFIQRASFDFEITDAGRGRGRGRRYHIPLLMSPFACSTYRGS